MPDQGILTDYSSHRLDSNKKTLTSDENPDSLSIGIGIFIHPLNFSHFLDSVYGRVSCPNFFIGHPGWGL
jgi:hypothetical protein